MATSAKLTDLLASGTDAGFEWDEGEVKYDPHKDRQLVSLGNAPHVKVTDVSKFEAAFPGVILGALNGTSIKVACQAVTRRALLRNRKVTVDEMKVGVLNALRGIKNRGGVVIQIRAFGQVFKSEQEYMDFGLPLLMGKGLSEEDAREVLAGAAETEEVVEDEATA
jgi:hypothetical protein